MHPVAFKIGNLCIYSYGLMMVIAYLVVLFIINFTRNFEDFDMDTSLDITIYAIIGGILGARLFYVLQNITNYISHPFSIINIREGGLSWHGALTGGIFGLFILHKIKKIKFGKLCDFASVNSTVGLAIGRIGCFLNGCCYGKITNVPWAFNFKEAGVYGLRHPTQLYESFFMIINFFILLYWWKKKKFDGELTFGMLFLYGITRFIVEIFRDNTQEQYIFNSPLSLAQWVSIFLVIISITVIIIKRKNISKDKSKY